MQGGFACREHRDALVPIVIRGGHGDGIVPGQSRHPGVVQEPAQHQNRLLVGPQRTPSGASSPPHTLRMQQTGQEQHSVLGYLQDSGVFDTHQARNPYEVDPW